MKESNDGNKAPKKSFLYYYGLVMLVLMLLNIFIFPSLMDRTEQVRYDQFVDEPVSYTHLDVYKRQCECIGDRVNFPENEAVV